MTKVDELLSAMELFDDPALELEKDVKKKKKKKKKDKKAEDASERNGDDEVIVPEKTKKKKKKKKSSEDLSDSHPDLTFASPETGTKKQTTLDPSLVSPIGISPGVLTPETNDRRKFTLSSKDCDKWGVEYFEALLEEIRAKCERKLKIKDRDKDSFISMCTDFYETWAEKKENDLWLMDLVEGNNPHKHETKTQTNEQLIEAQTDYGKELDDALIQQKKGCIKSALSVFMGLKEDSLTRIQEILVKGAIISQATPKKLADFASKGKQNKKLLKRLFGDAQLMKEMLHHGGASKYEYGEAIRIFVDCMELHRSSKKKSSEEKERDDDEYDYSDDDFEDDEWSKVHRKIALACALELASPLYEFDTSNTVEPVARYKHFVDAHKAGELDSAFPYFSVWEMRQIVNCDAPNDQMSWCRKMVMNYVPHLTCLTDVNLRYVYLLHSDVRNRKPTWTGSPRTYPMVLSGGGNESVNSWFGRFMLKSFGLPSWGSKFRRKEGYTRWTPEGWVALNGADWDNCSWRGKTGKDFKTEVEARNKAPPEEYFKRLVTLQCLADIVDGDPNKIPEEEKDVLHPERMWRSMAIVSMELLFQTEPEVVRTFKREFTGTGTSLVVTNGEKYLEKFQENANEAEIRYKQKEDKLLIPASRHGFVGGTIVVIESFEGGKQVNFVADGDIEYEIPDNVPSKTYVFSFDVCTVSSKQVPLMLKTRDDMEPFQVEIPYTRGEWQKTDGVPINIEAGATLRFSRPKGSLGLAVKNFMFAAP